MKDFILILPSLLIWLRLGIASLLVVDAFDGKISKFFLLGVLLGFLSDLLDGMIARRLKIANAALRIFDSYADIFFYVCLLASICLTHSGLVFDLYFPAMIVFLFQLVNWLVSLIKFNKLTSYHSYLAKIRALALFIGIMTLFQFGNSFFLWVSMLFAIISNIEGIIISLILPKWYCDVWTIFSAIKLRNDFFVSNIDSLETKGGVYVK